MAIEVSDMILFALFSGIGSGIGVPIGNAIFRRWLEPHFKRIENIKELIKNEVKKEKEASYN